MGSVVVVADDSERGPCLRVGNAGVGEGVELAMVQLRFVSSAVVLAS